MNASAQPAARTTAIGPARRDERVMFASTANGLPNPPWASQRAAWQEIENLQAAAAYEHRLFSSWPNSRSMGGRSAHDSYQATTTRFLALGGVRSCYDNWGDAARLGELAAAGVKGGFITVDQWLAEHNESGSDRENIDSLIEDVETIGLMQWAFAHEARIAMVKDRDFLSDLRRKTSADQVSRLKECARGNAGSVSEYQANGAEYDLRMLRQGAAASRSS
jgi:hypothetical protein